MNKIILVAGSTGNLGNRISRELSKRGADVRAIVRTSLVSPDLQSGLLSSGSVIL